MIKNLQSLRGIAAILIFFHHYGFQSDICISFGDFGVTFFMMLSGFVIYLSEEKKWRRRKSAVNLNEFLTSRIIKIFPLYLICWILAIAVVPYSGSAAGKLLGIFALQSWFPEMSIYFAGNGPSWFISDLIFCYIISVILFNLLHSRPKRGLYIIIAYYLIYSITVLTIPRNLVHAIIYINPLMQFSNFLTGFLLCRWFLSKTQTDNNSYATISQILSTAAIVLCMVLYRYIPERFSFGCYWWIAVIPCIYVFAAFDTCNNWINKLSHSAPLLLAGKLSFSFYLIHAIGINIWNRLLNYTNWISDDIIIYSLQSVVLLIILFIVAYGVNKYIELPLAKKLKYFCFKSNHAD